MNEQDQALFEKILSLKYDPLSFCRYVFPWGVPKTPLANFKDLRTWQIEELEKIGEHIQNNRRIISEGGISIPYYLSISSGRGPGKSAFLSFLSYYTASCWLGSTTIVTANTEPQLKSRTMAELGKWHQMAINRTWFEKKSLTLRPQKWFTEILNNQLSMDTQYYYVEGQNWSEENPDAFAGAHSQIGMVLLYDEASGIPDSIWKVSEGFFTDQAELRIWAAISNPRRPSGQFFNTFHNDSEFWNNRYIDSRTVEGVDKSVYERIVKKYGEDNDVTRVEVKGLFPRTGDRQFISYEVVNDAVIRELTEDPYSPLVMGVDPARFGSDESIIRFRKGRDSRSFPVHRFRRIDTMQLASEAAVLIDKMKPAAVFVDGGGVGGGVVDRLKQLGYRVIEVQSGGNPKEKERYKNKRAEMWADMRDWLETACIDDCELLISGFNSVEYQIPEHGRIVLESKKDMAKRGVPSPDDADALALTFAEPVAYIDYTRRNNRQVSYANTEYDIYGD